MSILSKTYLGFIVLLLLGLASSALAITEFDRLVQMRKPTSAPHYYVGYTPPLAVLPGTRPRRACIEHGQARCMQNRPSSPFPQRYHNRLREAEAIHPHTLPRDRYQIEQNF